MGLLEYDETNTDTGIKRTLKLSGNSIAVAYIDQEIPYFTLWWWLNENVDFTLIIDTWLTHVLPPQGIHPHSVPIMLEFWVSGEFYETELQPPVSQDTVFVELHKERQDHDVIEHILLT